jgi:pimeloyl-ACP methyl ester carboxylesterase
MNPFQGTMKPFPTLDSWSRQVHLPAADVNLHLVDSGDATLPVVLLVHGLGDEADTWRHVIPAISGARRVIAPDLPGFGRSDKPKRRYTIPFFSEVLVELLDRLELPRVVLVGHSTGGVIAQAVALDHPERIERLILIGGCLVTKETRLNLGLLLFLLPGVGELLYTRLRKDPQEAYRTLEGYYNRLADLPQADRDFLYQRVNERVWSDGQRRGFLSTLRNLAAWVPAQQKDLSARLQGCKIPTNLLWGANDLVNALANAQALVDLMPTARLTIVPGAGHNLQQEKPGVVIDAILSQGQASNIAG